MGGQQPIDDLPHTLATTWNGCDPVRLHDWAKVIAAVEFRLYLPDWRPHILDFLTRTWPSA